MIRKLNMRLPRFGLPPARRGHHTYDPFVVTHEDRDTPVRMT